MFKKGFTLIEVLIVVSIIAVLASILIVAVMGTIDPAKVKTTDRRIEILEDGLKRFVDKFPIRKSVAAGTSGRGYPRTDELKGVQNEASVSVENMTGGEFLRFILFPTETELETLKKYGITEAVLTQEEVSELLNEDFAKDENGRTIAKKAAFVDTWGYPFYYRFPGLNHSDKGVKALEHQNWREEYGLNHVARMNPKPDIWSSGANNLNDEDIWDKLNDPFNELDDSENDDITNWFENER